MSICNQLDLQTLGSQLVMSKNSHDHWFGHALIDACQQNYSTFLGDIIPKVIYGINVKTNEMPIICIAYTKECALSLWRNFKSKSLFLLKKIFEESKIEVIVSRIKKRNTFFYDKADKACTVYRY